MTAEPEDLIAAAIDAAEEICNPLEGLIEKAATDPGAPFVPEVLERLVALKKEDRAAFEVLRSQLKKTGCRVIAFDEAIADESGDTGGRGPMQADNVVHIRVGELAAEALGRQTALTWPELLDGTEIARLRAQVARPRPPQP
jgi:hypothetical protein